MLTRLHQLGEQATILITQAPYTWITIFMAIESSFLPLPSELIMIPAGYYVSLGKLDASFVILSGIVGSIIGALFNYYIAKLGGQKLLIRIVGIKNFEIGVHFFKKYGDIATFTGRLLPVVRHLISLPAGLFNMELKKFIIYTGVGAGIWSAFLVWLGWMAGENKEFVQKNMTYFIVGVVILILVIIPIKLYIIKKFGYVDKEIEKQENK